MVQKYHSPLRVYKYPFELVMAAYEKRFPTCPQIPIFLSCEIVRDETTPDGSETVIERRCKLNVDVPYLLKKIIGVDVVYFIQRNTLNRRKRRLLIEAWNESFANRVEIFETCEYFVHPENLGWTCFEQVANFEIKSFLGFENAIEKVAMKQYSSNIAKGKEIIDYFIEEMAKQGITEIPIWQEDAASDKSQAGSDEENEQANGEMQSPDEKEVREMLAEELTLGASASDLLRRHSVSQSLGSGDHKSFQLDHDYIQRYLGKLTMMQESKLVQLRECMAELQKGKALPDSTLLRFLRSTEYNLDKARENLCQSLQWRKKYQVDKILSEYSYPEVITTYFPGGWHHHDREGRPLYVMRLGQMDVKGLIKTIGEDGLLTLTLHICEEGLQLLEEATRKEGRPISSWSLLLDLEGLNMRHLWRPGIKALLRVIEIVEANYPETMGRVFIVRAPRVFPILWTLVSPFIHVNTRSKFLFYGGNDYQDEGGLMTHIPEEILPNFLGGTCSSRVVEGGLVPKSLYLSDDADWDRPLKEDSIYHCVTLTKGQVHEVVLSNEEAGSVITWDFDVLKHDISFRVIYTQTTIESSSSNTGGSSVIEQLGNEGAEYEFVESQLVCHDGESVQGSHVSAHAGCYILQWKFHIAPHKSTGQGVSESQKAHIMYYTDYLSSANYRGSLSSLQSSHSHQTAPSTSSTASR
ncbi:SEC14-like protein 1 isoform X2 [Neocloeon triangulifer]|uniref:SEC14-like protein 1 isoform X2 n=1 Tax=Neocloeon triangulifer TaxID=2078957 RepID=UPI00286EEC0D|nr:SEC14-like protein 1 isoform X2 [Neocloeon triangulifer]